MVPTRIKQPTMMSALLITLMSKCHVVSATPVSQDGKITFPLLTHHHVITRHLAESRQHIESYHQHDRRPTTLRRQLPQQQLGSLYQGYGTHYMDIWVGYPPQRQTAVVDTGSSVTAFPCSACTDCGIHADKPFNESQSESFHLTPCIGDRGRPCIHGQCDMAKSEGGECWLSHQYGDVNSPDSSGWTAYEAEDIAYAAGLHDAPVAHVESGEGDDPNNASEFSFALTFGCQTQVTGYFEKQLASGVMGLDRRAQSFWGQMRSQQVIHRAQFSLCFVRQPLASKAGTTAGAVTLGGTDERLNVSPMVYAKTVTEGGNASFKVRVRKMYLRENGGSSVMYDGTSTYHALELEKMDTLDDFDIDSGTTDTYLISALSGEFRRVWKDITRTEYTNSPVKLSEDQLRKLPTVMLQIIPHEGGVGDEVKFDNPAEIKGLAGKVDYGTPNDILFAIPAVHYMQHNGDGTYTARIYLDREDSAGSILGANAMMGHNILFDIDSGRIGLAESECDYARLVAEATGAPARSSSEVVTSSETTTATDENETTTPVDEPEICAGLKCQAFLGITCTFFFLMFFVFARRYVTKRDDFHDDRDFEMKSARGSNGRGGGYSDDEGSYGGSRSSYRDRAPPTSYSDDHRWSGSNERSNRHSSNNSHSSGHRRSGSDDGRGSRISGDRSQQSSRSHESRRSQQSHSGSIQSHHSSRSQRSHQSNRTSSSHRSSGERSSNSRGSHGSGGSRESSRSQRSSKSHRSSRSDRDPQGEYGSRRYYNDDEISRPPSIS